MSRNPYSPSKQLLAATALAFGATGIALADDNSITIRTGESYAEFNGGRTSRTANVSSKRGRSPEQSARAIDR